MEEWLERVDSLKSRHVFIKDGERARGKVAKNIVKRGSVGSF